jgi:uncharacterized protein (DUF302 family)
METTVQGSIEEVRAKVEEALKAQGFGILTEIDVRKTMKAKLGVDYEPYYILGACNPPLAHRALSTDPSTGLLLPCNVVLRSAGDAVQVLILDPEVMFAALDEETQTALAGLAEEAKTRLVAALAALERT